MDDRLSPATVRDIVRHHLKRLLYPRDQKSASADQSRPLAIHAYLPGETILSAQDRVDSLGLVVRGRVAVCPGPHWRNRSAAVLRPGQTFSQVKAVEGFGSGVTLQALTRSEVWFLRRPKLPALSREHLVRRPAATPGRRVLGALLLVVGLLAVLTLSRSPTLKASSLVFMGLGQWCSQLGHDSCAERAWSAAAALVPSDANPPLALGTLYSLRGELAAAEASFEQAQALLPGSPEVLNNLGFLYAGRGDHGQAVSVLRRALELEPGNAVIQHNLARSLQALGAHNEALLRYQSSLAQGGPKATALANMAIAYYETGQLSKAEEAAGKAVRYDNTMAPAYTVLGVVALESHKPEEAVLHLHRALSLDAGHGPARFYLGLAYSALGLVDEAIVALEEARTTTADEDLRVHIGRYLHELYEMQDAGPSP